MCHALCKVFCVISLIRWVARMLLKFPFFMFIHLTSLCGMQVLGTGNLVVSTAD